MSSHQKIQLGVNVDHIATLRQARGVDYPDPTQAAEVAREAGADGITVHLREDRRHIQEHDVVKIKQNIKLPLNLEIAATPAMLEFAIAIKPDECCLVPEKRQELTTEGGLDVISQIDYLSDYVEQLIENEIKTSLFIDPVADQIKASKQVGASIVELHTGAYAECLEEQSEPELHRLRESARLANELGLQVNAGHGLHYQNVKAVAAIPEIECLNIGHAIVARASISGFYESVFTMKKLMIEARLQSE